MIGIAPKLTSLFLLTFLLAGCALNDQQESVQLQIEPNARFSYSGRGAGAGIALMSTMGPAGIAIGVAIDEGIRKDLAASAAEAGFDIKQTVEQSALMLIPEISDVTVISFGMKDVRGSDLMFPYVELNYQLQNELVEALLEYQEESGFSAYELNEYKTDGAKIIQGFEALLNAGR